MSSLSPTWIRQAPPPRGRIQRSPAFDGQLFLDSADLGRTVKFRGSEIVFAQGDPTKNVRYLQEGSGKLTVVSAAGKEAVLAILGPGDCVGEKCLAGKSTRITTATSIGPTSVLVIEKNDMIRLLNEDNEFSDRFITFVLASNQRLEQELIDHLFNSSEKRLARRLLLAGYGAQGPPQKVVPKVSQENLARMIGTTCGRVNFFMNKFRKLAYIQYAGEFHIKSSLLRVVLRQGRTETLRYLGWVGRDQVERFRNVTSARDEHH
jgi:CRP-like cAMP-binding protein